jgi:rhodanese-related sulfurtransferase
VKDKDAAVVLYDQDGTDVTKLLNVAIAKGYINFVALEGGFNEYKKKFLSDI